MMFSYVSLRMTRPQMYSVRCCAGLLRNFFSYNGSLFIDACTGYKALADVYNHNILLLDVRREVLPLYVDAEVGKQVIVVDKDLTQDLLTNSSSTYSAHLQHLREYTEHLDVSATRLVLFPVFDQ